METFHYYPKLPVELRLEIWRAYFAAWDKEQQHTFISDQEGIRHDDRACETNGTIYEGYNILGEAQICAESWIIFKEFFKEPFAVGDMRDLLPHAPIRKIHGALRFAIREGDEVSIRGTERHFLFAALRSTSWYPYKEEAYLKKIVPSKIPEIVGD
ncbi:hypothetical protein GGR58DRAFT_500121 [Xylaria digitata]|nr:hypothetical protein GGR58DRAFT_500121 [Xylaria digitata]